jgi:hypothetical protein
MERLDGTLTETRQEFLDLEARVDAEAEKLQELDRLLDRKRELLTEISLMQRERTEAEKATRAMERRLEFERRRFERLGQRRNGRPVRVDVDDEAWAVLQRDVVAQGVYLIWRMGELVRFEMDQLAAGTVPGRPPFRRRRGPGEGEPSPRRRFIRIQIDDETWKAFRLAAVDLGVSSARYPARSPRRRRTDWVGEPHRGRTEPLHGSCFYAAVSTVRFGPAGCPRAAPMPYPVGTRLRCSPAMSTACEPRCAASRRSRRAQARRADDTASTGAGTGRPTPLPTAP